MYALCRKNITKVTGQMPIKRIAIDRKKYRIIIIINSFRSEIIIAFTYSKRNKNHYESLFFIASF